MTDDLDRAREGRELRKLRREHDRLRRELVHLRVAAAIAFGLLLADPPFGRFAAVLLGAALYALVCGVLHLVGRARRRKSDPGAGRTAGPTPGIGAR